MCKHLPEFKQLPFVSVVILIACVILLCITSSCSDAGLLLVNTTYGSISATASYGWDIAGNTDWELISSLYEEGSVLLEMLELDYKTCYTYGYIVGALSIFTVVGIFVVVSTFLYFRMYKTIKKELCKGFPQRLLLIIFCYVPPLYLIISSAYFFSFCGGYFDNFEVEALETAQTETPAVKVSVSPDYGLILLWLSCAALLGVGGLNSGIFKWSEEISANAKQIGEVHHYDNVSPTESAADIIGEQQEQQQHVEGVDVLMTQPR